MHAPIGPHHSVGACNLILDMMLWSTDICQSRVSADQYHMTVSRAQVSIVI